jgi:hypothetical protein
MQIKPAWPNKKIEGCLGRLNRYSCVFFFTLVPWEWNEFISFTSPFFSLQFAAHAPSSSSSTEKKYLSEVSSALSKGERRRPMRRGYLTRAEVAAEDGSSIASAKVGTRRSSGWEPPCTRGRQRAYAGQHRSRPVTDGITARPQSSLASWFWFLRYCIYRPSSAHQ